MGLEQEDLHYALYESAILNRTGIAGRFEKAIGDWSSRSAGHPRWREAAILAVRFHCKHIEDVLNFESPPESRRGFLFCVSRGTPTPTLHFWGSAKQAEADPDRELQDTVLTYLANEPILGTENVHTPLSILIDSEYPLVVPIGPKSRDGRLAVAYVIALADDDPLTHVRSSVLGHVIQFASRHAQFNRASAKYLREADEALRAAIQNDSVEQVAALAVDHWKLCCLCGTKDDQLRMLRHVADYATRVCLGQRWERAQLLAETILPEIEAWGVGTGEQDMVLRRLSAASTANRGTSKPMSPNNPDLSMRWIECLGLSRCQRGEWSVKSITERVSECDRLVALVRDLCVDTERYLLNLLFEGGICPASAVKLEDGWTRGYFALLLVRELAGCAALEKLGTPGSPLWLGRIMDLARTVLVPVLASDSPDLSTPFVAYDPVAYTEALITMLSWYAHEVVGVPLDLPVDRLLRKAFQAESALFALRPFYRDHLYHAIDVCMLGDLLLSNDIDGGYRVSSLPGDARVQWYIAGLLHDIGYVVEVAGGGILALESLHSNQVLELRNRLDSAHRDAMQEFCESAYEKVDLRRNPCVLNGIDHGVASAASILEHLGDAGSKFRPAIDAVIAHNLHPEYPIDQTSHPLSALLVLCDELQEWGRSTVQAALHARHVAATRNLGEYPLTKLRPLQHLGIRGKDGTTRFSLQYRPPGEHQADVAYLWLSKCANLQRVRWDVDVGPWQIELNTPQREEYRELKLHEMRLMETCAWEFDELRPLRTWLRFVRTSCQYRADEDAPEVLSFSLNSFGPSPGPVQPDALRCLGEYTSRREQALATVRRRRWAR